MSESTELTQTLSKFTPDAGTLDADAILFAAGQGSMRTALRRWQIFAAGLLLLNGVTVAVFWPKETVAVPPAGIPPIVETNPLPASPVMSAPEGTLAWQRRWLSGEVPSNVSFVGEIPDAPVLTVLSGRSSITEY
jgi:hypothetical protein